MRITVSIVVIVFIFGCAGKTSEEIMPSDFGFICTTRFAERLNTFNATFTRQLSVNDTVIKVVFTKTEMQQVYDSLVANDFWNMPKQIPLDTIGCNSSWANLFIKVFADGKEKIVNYEECGPKNEIRYIQIEKIFATIRSILDLKPSYKEIKISPIPRL